MTAPGVDAPQDRIAPPAFLGAPAPAAVLAALPGARAVGGCVRDALAGAAVHDVDIAAPLPPERIAALLRAAGLKVFETGLAHGTVTAVLDHVPVEVTALRRDVVTDGRHAEVAWTTDWREDAARRDFRINAMSCDAAGRLWDYFDGREDLAAGRVRFVGDPATRLAEDYLRALRFFRFWARYGRGTPDADALAAIRDAVPGILRRIAPERVWMEMKRLLQAPDPRDALTLMAECGLLAAVLPEAISAGGDLPAVWPPMALQRLVHRDAPADPLLRLATLLPPGRADALASRLRLSGDERETLRRLGDVEAPEGGGEDGAEAIRRFLARRALWPPADVLREAWLAEARDGHSRAVLREAMQAAPWPVFPLLGRDLIAAGVPHGPLVGRMLSSLREWWIEEGAVADRVACLAELRRRLRQSRAAAKGPASPE